MKNKKLVMINFFMSLDDGENWIPIPKDRLPEDVSKDDVIEKMLDGLACYHKDSAASYIALRSGTMH